MENKSHVPNHQPDKCKHIVNIYIYIYIYVYIYNIILVNNHNTLQRSQNIIKATSGSQRVTIFEMPILPGPSAISGLAFCAHQGPTRVARSTLVVSLEFGKCRCCSSTKIQYLMVLNVGNGWEWGNGMIIDHSYCGSFPHSLLSTSKNMSS